MLKLLLLLALSVPPDPVISHILAFFSKGCGSSDAPLDDDDEEEEKDDEEEEKEEEEEEDEVGPGLNILRSLLSSTALSAHCCTKLLWYVFFFVNVTKAF